MTVLTAEAFWRFPKREGSDTLSTLAISLRALYGTSEKDRLGEIFEKPVHGQDLPERATGELEVFQIYQGGGSILIWAASPYRQSFPLAA